MAVEPGRQEPASQCSHSTALPARQRAGDALAPSQGAGGCQPAHAAAAAGHAPLAPVPPGQVAVIKTMEDMSRAEGIAFFKMTTLRTRLTRGVQRLMAPYMGMFIPCRALKEREEWVDVRGEGG